MESHASSQRSKNVQGTTVLEPPMEFLEGVNPSVGSVEAVIREVAQSDVPVLLLAEKGAGKKATAQRVHQLSRRSRHSFRVIACASLEADNLGQFEQEALLEKGTIFLEEVAELNAEGQEWLVRALTRVNGHGDRIPGAARLIGGSARDLEAEVNAGNLREDLYYRISGVCLRIPPLRQRREDIPMLMEHFLRKFAQEFQRNVPVLTAETQRLFQEYSWPGNVRELENAARAIVALGDEKVAMGGLRAMLMRPSQGVNGSRVSLKQATRDASREVEKEIILRALNQTRWNRRRAAQQLQISYKALLYKLKQMGCSKYGVS